MRPLAITFAVLAAISWLLSTADRSPWDGGFKDFAWWKKSYPYLEFAIGIEHIALTYPIADGVQSWKVEWATQFTIWKSFRSREYSLLLRDDRVWPGDPNFDQSVLDRYNSIRDRDEKLSWRWPRRS